MRGKASSRPTRSDDEVDTREESALNVNATNAHATEHAAQVSEPVEKARLAKRAARRLALLSRQEKDEALTKMADALVDRAEAILEANALDVTGAEKNGAPAARIDRLRLTTERIHAIAEGVREIVELDDPVGRVDRAWRQPNGLEISQVRVPLGVIGIIYEARPNVTADAAALCLKSGNAAILRGSSDAIHSNKAITAVLQQAQSEVGLPEGSLSLIEDTRRETAQEMMGLNGLIDVLIPRGGAGLIQAVVKHATVPVIETGVGNCHVYVDRDADLEKAQAIIVNAKTKRPSVCCAAESLLVHQEVAAQFLPKAAEALTAAGVTLRGCERTRALVPQAEPATEDDWYCEYLDLILAVRVVDTLDEAIEHVEEYGSHHSDAIVSENYTSVRRFTREVDSAAVYANASTYFTDGNQFGFGAEIGISTQKLHVRGPMGLPELTSTKYVVLGEGHIRT